jgi:hypothetical protein
VAVSAAQGSGLEALLHKADRTLFAEGASASPGTLAPALARVKRQEPLEAPTEPAVRAVGT